MRRNICLGIGLTANPGRTTLKPEGEFDSATCGQLIDALEEAHSDRDLSELVLDLTDLSFID